MGWLELVAAWLREFAKRASPIFVIFVLALALWMVWG